jgi:hypothetical protein
MLALEFRIALPKLRIYAHGFDIRFDVPLRIGLRESFHDVGPGERRASGLSIRVKGAERGAERG